MSEIIFNILGDITSLIEKYNYYIIFILMAIESSFIPFPSEIVMIPAGYLVAKGELSLILVLFFGIIGSVFGAFINYYLAKFVGLKFLKKYGKYFFITESILKKSELFFKSHGSISTFIARLIPGIRQVISIPAGLSNMCLYRFTIFTFCGAGIWIFILTMIGVLVGYNEVLIKEYLTNATVAIFAFLFFIMIVYLFLKKKS